MFLLALAAAAAQPQPGALKTFGDWEVGCDNVLNCSMRSLRERGPEAPDISLTISRSDGRLAPAMFLAVRDNGEYVAEFAVMVDGVPYRRDALTDEEHRAVLKLPGALSLSVVGDRPISLRGVVEAMRHMDRVQNRSGTVTALVEIGEKGPLTIAIARQPSEVSIKDVADETLQVSPTIVAGMRRFARCGRGDEPVQAETFSDDTTLVLIPCGADPANRWTAAFTLRQNRWTPALIEQPSTPVWPIIASVTRLANPRWYKGQLSVRFNRSASDDCGVRQDLFWDGTSLRLTHQEELGVCQGRADFITTWQAYQRVRN